MNRVRLVLIVLGVAVSLLSSGTARAQQDADTLNIRYRLDSIAVDMGYADNAKAWESFVSNFMDRYSGKSPSALRLDIYSGASPEGTASHNRWLGENRGQAIRRLVRRELPGRIGRIIVHNEGARWDAFYEAVAASSEPWRDEVLRILDLPASTYEDRCDHREYKLRALRGGTVWPVLLEKYLSPLRSGATAVLSWNPVRDTLVVRDTVVMMTAPVADLLEPPAAGSYDEVAEPQPERKPAERYPIWILRTNLPLLAIGTPNLQAEMSLDRKDRWSINLEGVWSWWTFSHNDHANEILYGSLELRRWLGQRWRHHTLDGWHVGLAFGGGYGDLEWKARGYQAEVYSGFINVGWQHRFGRRRQWAFDAGIGLGYAYVTWRRYRGSRIFPENHEEQYSDHLMWRETGRNHWIGTPHLNISLGYCLPQHDARWRRMKAMEREAERNAYLHWRDSVKATEQYELDSIRTADRQRRMEIGLLKGAERKEAQEAFEQELRQREQAAKAARQKAREELRQRRQQQREELRENRRLEREAKVRRRQELKQEKAYAKSPEGRAQAKERREAARLARQQARADRKAARKQARLDRRQERIRMRTDLQRQRNLDELHRKLEKADGRYKSMNN